MAPNNSVFFKKKKVVTTWEKCSKPMKRQMRDLLSSVCINRERGASFDNSYCYMGA